MPTRCLSRTPALTLTILLGLSLGGCSRGDRPRLAEASGKVTMDGVAVASASISFQPVNGGRVSTGVTDEEGVYRMSTYEANDGAPVGEHYVSVMKVGGDGAFTPAQEDAIKKDELALSEISDDASAESGPAPEPEIEYLVPKHYMDPKTSGLKVTVPSGGSTELNIELKK